MAAADEDDDALAESGKLKPLLSLADRVSVFYNRKDGILLSQSERLGVNGPKSPVTGVNLKDCTRDASGGIVNQHTYVLLSSDVRDDVRQVLDGN